MRKDVEGELFTYPPIYKSLLVFSIIVVFIVTIWLALTLISTLLSSGLDSASPVQQLFAFLMVFLFLFLPVTVLIIQLNTAQGFMLSEQGLRLQVFRIWWKDLPWDSVLELNDSWLYPGLTTVVLKRLTPLHHLLGIIFAFTNRPAFIIHVSLGLDDYRKALEIIRKYAMNLR